MSKVTGLDGVSLVLGAVRHLLERAGTYGFLDDEYREGIREIEGLKAERDTLQTKLNGTNELVEEWGNHIHCLEAKLERAKNMLMVCHDAIKSLPEDALGVGEVNWNGEPYQYPIRDEVIDKINKSMKELES